MRVCIPVWFICSFAFAALAQNQSPDWQTKAPRAERERPQLTLDVRLLAGPLGTFIDEPSEADKAATLSTGQSVRVPYSGFGGLGHSVGLTFGLTYDRFIGFETGYLTRKENATATYNINGGSYDIEVEQDSATVPLLLRLTLPTDSVQPSLLFGMAFHFPDTSELKSLNLAGLSSTASSYQTLNFGFELEFKLPVKDYDIRIPLSLRGYHNQELGDKAIERVNLSPGNQTEFITEWQWAAEVLLGLTVHHQLLD